MCFYYLVQAVWFSIVVGGLFSFLSDSVSEGSVAVLCLLKQAFVLNLIVEQRTLLHRLISTLDHLTLYRSFTTTLIRMLRFH
jgi:hypothetical protein